MKVILSIISWSKFFWSWIKQIYSKVLQILIKFRREGHTALLGGFHIIICLLSTIYSICKGSGITELLLEAGVGAEGRIKAALRASNDKQGVHYYKLLLECVGSHGNDNEWTDTELFKNNSMKLMMHNLEIWWCGCIHS